MAGVRAFQQLEVAATVERDRRKKRWREGGRENERVAISRVRVAVANPRTSERTPDERERRTERGVEGRACVRVCTVIRIPSRR